MNHLLIDHRDVLADWDYIRVSATIWSSHHSIPRLGGPLPKIKPFGPLTLDLPSSCFQYGGNIFEGMKVRRLAPLWWMLDGRRVGLPWT